MPHIKPRRRVQIARPRPKADVERPINAGELCWLLYECCRQFVEHHDPAGLRFSTAAEVVAALEQAKNEFQRTQVHPLEDLKRATQGDAFEPPRADDDFGAEGLPG